jgi:hypothetical protein
MVLLLPKLVLDLHVPQGAIIAIVSRRHSRCLAEFAFEVRARAGLPPFAFQALGRGPEAPGSSQVSSKSPSYLTTMSPASQRSAVHPESRAVKRQRLAANVPTGVEICSSPMSS